MSAPELRQAAETLRRQATAATPGPWRAEYSKASGDCVIDAESHNCLDSVARTTHFRSGLDAAYIATMHPGVGLALADLLDETAETWSLMGSPESSADDSGEFIRLARLINGGGA